MDKKTETMTFRTTPELKAAIEAVALALDTSPSKLIGSACQRLVDEERRRFEHLSRVFGSRLRLPRAPDGDTTDV